MPEQTESTRIDLPYPMPWCIESKRSKSRKNTREHSDNGSSADEDESTLERWLGEFTDKQTGCVCPPPMS